jgi:ABC-type transport system substrate-binding protein
MAQLDVPAINAAIDAARALADPAQRARAWAAVDRRITAQAPGVPLVWGRFVSVRSADTLGVINQSLATWDLAHSALR